MGHVVEMVLGDAELEIVEGLLVEMKAMLGDGSVGQQQQCIGCQ